MQFMPDEGGVNSVLDYVKYESLQLHWCYNGGRTGLR